MKKIPKPTYLTAEEIEQLISEREDDARMLPPGEVRQSVLKEVAQLRVYAAAKRWLAPQS